MRTILLPLVLLLMPISASAQTTFTASNEAELREAINNATDGDKIVLGANITLTEGDLPTLHTAITFDGGGHSLSGNGQFRGLVVASYPDGPGSVDVTIQNLTITNTLARGGNGGDGSGGGGGGAGLGGGLFVSNLSNVTLVNVNFATNAAVGGNGGSATNAAAGGGGGGGLGGNGAAGVAGSGGGGGGFGSAANGGTSGNGGGTGILVGGSSGGWSGSIEGGQQGGGGAASGQGAGGGGENGGYGVSGFAGNGGYGGGGGGGATGGQTAGFGGFGGGGGGSTLGFAGRYAGAGGDTVSPTGLGGGSFGGGSGGGSAAPGGGGGGALGGGIFVESGGTITIGGSVSVNGASVTGGRGGTGGADGIGTGAGMFFGGFGTVVFASGAGETQTIANTISDEYGFFPDSDNGKWTLNKTGAGTLILSGNNTYNGGTVVDGGTVSVSSGANLGGGDVTLRNTSTLAITGSSTFAQNVNLAGTPVISLSDGINATLNGVVADEFMTFSNTLAVKGGGTLTLGNAANTYSGGTLVTGGATVVINADSALGAAGTGVTLGDATSKGTLGYANGTTLATARNFTLGAGGGVVDTAGNATITLSGGITGAGTFGKTGAGTLTLSGTNTYTGGTIVDNGVLRAGIANAFGGGAIVVNGQGSIDFNGFNQTWGSLAGAGGVTLGTATLDAGGDNTNTLFSGSLSGGGGLIKSGTGVLTMTGLNTYTGGTTVNGGVLAGTTDGLQGNIANNAAVLFNQNTAGTYGGNMNGTGVLVKSGTGTVTLSGVNTYTGGTLVSGGTLAGNTDSLQGNITNNANVLFNQNLAGTFAGAMNGTGTLTKSGSGVLTLTGANTYSGGTTVAAGTLAGTTATLQGNITNNAAVLFNQNGNGTYAGAMSGTGTLTKTGTGLVTLTGTNTYSGGTLVSAGALGGTTDSLQGNITNNAAVLFNQAGNGSYGGNMGGTGVLVKQGAGTVTLSGTNTYSGGTMISAGTLAGDATSIQGDILNDASLVFNQGSNGTYAGIIAGTGSVTKTGAGTLTLTGQTGYTGGTTVTAGTLAGNTLNLQGTILNNAAVVFDQNANGTYAGAMSGTGSLTKAGTGLVTLTGTNTYTGGTLVSAGGLGGTTDSLQGSITNNAAVLFNQAVNGTYAGNMTGTGVLVKQGAGTVTLTGTNTYSGGTMISAGTLAGDTRSIQGDILNDAQLVFNQGADGIYAGNIAGSGAVTKTGAGTLTLTGQTAYTGGTTISAGTLEGNILNLQGAILNNASLRFNQSFNGIFNGTITGSGSVNKTGTGLVVLNGANTYTGGTTVSAGALMGNTLSLQGNIVNQAQVIFDQVTAGTYAGAMSGSGGLVKQGAGNLTLTGTNTYTGGTFINGGMVTGDAGSLQGVIINNGIAVFNQNSDGIFSGILAGTGSLTKMGTGTLTMTGQSAYSGGTTITAGTLAGTTLQLQGNILNNGALLFNQGFAGTFFGNISGTGSLTKSGTGMLFLDGLNTYTGGTTVNGGSLVGTTSSLQGSILNNATVIFNQNLNGIYSGVMSGSGSLVKAGTGTLTLTGANSYAGGTTISGGGAISVALDAALGAVSGAVALGDAASAGTLTFTNGGLFSSSRGFSLGAGGGVFNTTGAGVTLSGTIGGSGALTKTGDGVLTLAGTSTYTGATAINGGTLRAGTSNAFGSGSALFVGAGAVADLNGFSQSVGSIAGSGSLLLGSGTLTTGSDNSSGLFAGAITGTGSLVKTGGGTLLLTGANTYSGGTSLLSGALVGNTTSLQGNIFNNGLVQFDQNASGTYAGSMSGSGALAKTGSGVLTLSGTNTYTGGTMVSGGSIVGTASSLRGLIVNNSQLTFGGAADGAFSGMLTGTGSLFKTGTGTLTLTGAQPLSGLLSVSQGTLALNGIYGGSVDVAAGATLRANGIIGGSLNLAGSLFALPPGGFGSQGTTTNATGNAIEGASYLTIGRDLTSSNGALLDFAIGPGTSPTIVVGGAASLNGARINVTAPAIGTARSSSFLALAAANGLSFTNAVVTSPDAGVLPFLKQDRNSIYVTLLNLNVPLSKIATGPGIISIADAIDRTKLGKDGDAGMVIRELTALDDGGLKDALEQIRGQVHATVLQTAVLDTESVTDLIRDQLSAREVEEGNDFRVWGETACQNANFKATDRARGGSANVCAGAGGADRRLSEHWTLGGGGSFTDGSMGLGNMGSGDYKAPRAFGYVGYKPRRFGFRGGGSAAKSSYKTEREIKFQAVLPPELGAQPISEGVNRKAEAEQKGATKDSWSEFHDSRKILGYTVEALVGVRHATVSRSAFVETGALALSLNGEDQTISLTQTDVKVHGFRRSGFLRPFFDFNYRRELAEGKTATEVELSGLPGSNFVTEGINVPADSYSTRLGMTFATLFGQATFTYEYKQAPGQKRQTVGFRFRFK